MLLSRVQPPYPAVSRCERRSATRAPLPLPRSWQRSPLSSFQGTTPDEGSEQSDLTQDGDGVRVDVLALDLPVLGRDNVDALPLDAGPRGRLPRQRPPRACRGWEGACQGGLQGGGARARCRRRGTTGGARNNHASRPHHAKAGFGDRGQDELRRARRSAATSHVTSLYLRCVTPGASTARTCSSRTSASARLSKRRAPPASSTGTT
jgi:hypothetical protein